MKYAIIAAGEGSRLAAEGITVPKPLVEVNGEYLIDRLIRIFMQNDAEEIVIICNDLTTLVAGHLVELQRDGLKGRPVPLRFVVKSTPSSMHSFFEISQFLTDHHGLMICCIGAKHSVTTHYSNYLYLIVIMEECLHCIQDTGVVDAACYVLSTAGGLLARLRYMHKDTGIQAALETHRVVGIKVIEQVVTSIKFVANHVVRYIMKVLMQCLEVIETKEIIVKHGLDLLKGN